MEWYIEFYFLKFLVLKCFLLLIWLLLWKLSLLWGVIIIYFDLYSLVYMTECFKVNYFLILETYLVKFFIHDLMPCLNMFYSYLRSCDWLLIRVSYVILSLFKFLPYIVGIWVSIDWKWIRIHLSHSWYMFILFHMPWCASLMWILSPLSLWFTYWIHTLRFIVLHSWLD